MGCRRLCVGLLDAYYSICSINKVVHGTLPVLVERLYLQLLLSLSFTRLHVCG